MAKLRDVYIIHGWAYSVDKWQSLLKLLPTEGVQPQMLNVPGLTSPSQDVWDIERYVEWLHQQIGDKQNPIVLGHSNGGRIALNYNMRHPGVISHLVLLDSAGVSTNPAALSRKRRMVALAARVLAPIKHIPGLRMMVYRLLGATDYLNAPENMKRTLANMLASDQYLDTSQTTMPVSIIWGDGDQQTPLEQAGILRQRLANVVSYDIIPGARHAPYHTHPEELAKIIGRVVREDA